MDWPYFSRGSSASPFDPTFLMSCPVSNVICCLVFGERFSYDNEHFLSLLKIISQTLKHFSSPVGQVSHDVSKEIGLTLLKLKISYRDYIAVFAWLNILQVLIKKVYLLKHTLQSVFVLYAQQTL